MFGSIGTVLYRATLSASMPPGLPADATAAAMATISGAVAAARAAPGPVGDALLVASRAAFTDALQLTAATGVVVLVAASIVSARILRQAGGASSAAHRGHRPL